MKRFILVATFKGKTWVLDEADLDLDWETQAQAHIANKEAKFTYDRATALLLAHNVQRKTQTEGGVWEVFIKPQTADTKPRGADTKPRGADTKSRKEAWKGSK